MLRGKKPCNFQNPSAFLSWLSKTFSRQNTKKNRPQVGTHKVNGSFSAIAVSFLCEINDQPGAIVCSFHGFSLNFIEWKPKNLKQSSILEKIDFHPKWFNISWNYLKNVRMTNEKKRRKKEMGERSHTRVHLIALPFAHGVPIFTSSQWIILLLNGHLPFNIEW